MMKNVIAMSALRFAKDIASDYVLVLMAAIPFVALLLFKSPTPESVDGIACSATVWILSLYLLVRLIGLVTGSLDREAEAPKPSPLTRGFLMAIVYSGLLAVASVSASLILKYALQIRWSAQFIARLGESLAVLCVVLMFIFLCSDKLHQHFLVACMRRLRGNGPHLKSLHSEQQLAEDTAKYFNHVDPDRDLVTLGR